MRFKKVMDGDQDAFWISPRETNGEFDYWFVIRWQNLDDYEFEDGHRHLMTLSIASPDQVPPKTMDSVFESFGFDAGYEAELRGSYRREELVTLLVEYGAAVTAWQKTGNNKAELLKEAHSEAKMSEMMFGFVMDRAVNMIGTTGWDAIQGNILGGLDRYKDELELI